MALPSRGPHVAAADDSQDSFVASLAEADVVVVEGASQEVRDVEDLVADDESIYEVVRAGRALQRACRESIVPPKYLLRPRSPGVCSVTDIVRQLWCEQQLLFSQIRPEDVVRTQAQEAGDIRHQELEAELHDVVEVEVETREDRFALRLANTLVNLEELRRQGRTRELFVAGYVEALDMQVHGIIDEIVVENGAMLLSDTKTRSGPNPSAPSLAQAEGVRLQLSLYHLLLTTLVSGDARSMLESAQRLRLDIDAQLSPSVCPGERSTTLRELSTVVARELESLPPVGSQMRAVYEAQETGKALGTLSFSFNPQWLAHKLRELRPFWDGSRSAQGVGHDQVWKCKRCEFARSCTVTPAVHPDAEEHVQPMLDADVALGLRSRSKV